MSAPQHPLGPGDPASVGPYRLAAVLGAGATGKVYLGHTPAGAAVAVKVLHRAHVADPALRERFEQDVAAAGRVRGIYAVAVLDSDLGADEPWLATAYVPGPSLRDAVIAGGPLTVDATLRLVAGVAEALQEVHAAGVTHRDLKPTNIILTADGPRITDTGISPAAQLSSPESDVAAVGHLAVFAATGGQGGIEHCPEPVRTIAAACTADDPRQRPTPAEIIQRCQAVASGSPPALPTDATVAPSETPIAGPPRRPGRRLVLRTVGLLIVGAAGIGGAIATRPRGGSSPNQAEPTSDVPTYPPAATLTGHTHNVSDLAYGPDGTLISAGWDDTIRLWDVASHRQRSAIATNPGGRADTVQKMAISSTGQAATAGFSDTIVLWNLATGLRVAEFVGHTGDVTAVAFSPDGQTLASAGMDNVVRLWNTTSRQQTGIIRNGATEGSAALAFSPDGALLATSDHTGQVWLWDMAQRYEITNLPKHDGWVDDLEFSRDGRLLAGCGYGGNVPVWDVTEHRRVATLPGRFTGVRGVAFSPDGRTLATGTDDNTVQLWNVADRRHRATLTGTGPGRAVNAVAYSPDGQLIAAASGDKTVQLWEARG